MEESTRILLVETDPSLRVRLASALRGWGYAVETACDGCEALQKVARFEPAVIISDMAAPRIGGIELLRAVRNQFRDTRFIILTDTWNLERIFEAARLGAFAVLQKPVQVELICSDLQNCLDHRTLAACCSDDTFAYCEERMHPSLGKYGFRENLN